MPFPFRFCGLFSIEVIFWAQVSPDIQVYAYFRTPMSFFFFWDMALSGILMGLAYTVETTVISSLSIALMVALVCLSPLF